MRIAASSLHSTGSSSSSFILHVLLSGLLSLQHDAGDHPSSPSVPPVGLKRGRSAKVATTAVGPLVAGGPPLNPEFCLRGIPPPLVGVAASRRASRHPLGSLLGATEWKPPALLEGASGNHEGCFLWMKSILLVLFF